VLRAAFTSLAVLLLMIQARCTSVASAGLACARHQQGHAGAPYKRYMAAGKLPGLTRRACLCPVTGDPTGGPGSLISAAAGAGAGSRPGSPAVPACAQQWATRLPGGRGLDLGRPQVLEPLRLACAQDAPRLALPALACLHKLVRRDGARCACDGSHACSCLAAPCSRCALRIGAPCCSPAQARSHWLR